MMGNQSQGGVGVGFIVLLIIVFNIAGGPDEWPPALVVMACFALVAGGSLSWQWVWGKRVEDQVWVKVRQPDSLDKLENSARGIVVARAVHFKSERDDWDKSAKGVRQSFLGRTQETAEKWRTIFAALLGLFGSVLLIKGPGTLAGTSGEVLYSLLMTSLILAIHAVAFTGWASAGMPKMLVDATAETLYVKQMGHASRALVRLRIGLAMGGLSAITLTAAAAAWLSSAP